MLKHAAKMELRDSTPPRSASSRRHSADSLSLRGTLWPLSYM